MAKFDKIGILVVAVLAVMLSSCHSSKTVTDNHGKVNVTTDTSVPEKRSDDWSTLRVKLDKGDNTKLYSEAREWLGTPYEFAGTTKNGVDCSGFVMTLYQSVYGIKLEHNSAKIYEKNCKEINRDELREGDLVFFNGTKGGRINHVGIYLKQGYFVHASSSRGVVVSNLSQNYYNIHFFSAGRVK